MTTKQLDQIEKKIIDEQIAAEEKTVQRMKEIISGRNPTDGSVESRRALLWI